ncbi:EAL domain-containing protein [Streptomyces sp. ACA25]|uniref:putative bifunctional diguanylate cyclase/phosphodiesterase n=1 Tax=Streptomyces sp. ACA25 TaxID=3022596 RepID=UPI0023080BE3|nr:EAL domain-containing protein [Streptomyces sp. ACA25]MDB1089591.1 EAL domain-containing protein [Streptomyces sp. ACA25]
MNGPLTTSAESAADGGYRAAFHTARTPMALVDPSGHILAANRALGTLLGTDHTALLGARADAATGMDGDDRIRAPYRAVLRGRLDRMRCTRPLKHPDGHTLWVQITVERAEAAGPAPDAGRPTADGRPRALLTVTDLSRHRRLRERLRHLRTHDPVTRLPNRTLFLERLTEALAASPTGRVGMCFLDLDGFRAVNDTFGHRDGDQLLGAVAQRLVRCASQSPPGGQLVARLGGDEFAVLVEASAGTEQLTSLAGAVTAALRLPCTVAGRQLPISASIGVVERACADTTATALMQAADTALHWAKADGKARWTLYDPERDARRLTRRELSSTLRPAVERGEFRLEYQPIVGLADGLPQGAEALVRWQHPRLGRLSPDRFIGLAEENGAIVPLGRWVLAEACRQARRWQREHAGTPLYVSVNLAVRQVWDSDLVADVAGVLGETGLAPALLQLELTESAVMGSAGRPLQALQDLSDMGVRIALDDFGTGYSNLAYLCRLPVRALKLDGTFVRGFRDARELGPADETLVSALVELAHKLGLTVTAECVEGRDQADRLRRIGCDAGQGWHWARPMPGERITELLG